MTVCNSVRARKCGRVLFVITLLLMLFAFLPVLCIISIYRAILTEDITALVGGSFVMLALPVSFAEIMHHMIFYSSPTLQKHIIRILWMVPIYALNAWIGLVYPRQGIYVDCARECYEAYVIYNFLKFLLNYLNEEMDLEINLALKPQVKHFFPMCWLPNWRMGRSFVHACKHGILQYTVVRPVTTFISFICELEGVYEEGQFRGDVAFPYIIAVNNLSQFMAMYCLVLFYRANKEELSPMKPIGKFICIKSVIFFSFFQGFLISIATYTGIYQTIFGIEDDNITELSNKLQNFLICIEMFIAAIAHHYCFSYKEFVNDLVEKRTLLDAVFAMWDVSDVHADLKEHFGFYGDSISNINKQIMRQSITSPTTSEEREKLLSNASNISASPHSSTLPSCSYDSIDFSRNVTS